MTLVAGVGASQRPPRGKPKPATASPSLFVSAPAVLLIGLSLGLAVSLQKLIAVWQTGAFFDTDDAMRLVQVRDWLAGQGWFDLTAYRLDPPAGVPLHWTRVLDVPLALLIRSFSLFTTQDTAERLTRIVFPMLLQVAYFGGIISLARRLVGVRGIAVATILAAFSVAITAQFPPGRIDHHGAQITLLVWMLRLTLDGLDAGCVRSAALAGVLAALSLAISIENLPFILVMVALFAAVWIVRGEPLGAAILALGGALAASAAAAFAATIPPSRYLQDSCDAFSAAHLIAAVAGGGGLVLLGLASPRLPGWRTRLAGMAAVAALVLVAVRLTYPDCLGDPLARLDPLVRDVWLRNVTEARPMWLLLQRKTVSTLPIAVPLFLGVAATFVAAARETGRSRLRWLAVAAFGCVGAAGAFWQLRVATSTAPIVLLGGAWAFVGAWRWAATRSRAFVIVPVLLAALFTPVTWALALPDGEAKGPQPYGDPQACFAPAAFQALEALPASTLLAPIDAASYVMAFTRHSVLAGPYHRDNRGNRLALDVFLGDPDSVHDRVAASGAAYVIVCPAAEEMSVYADRAPGGLAAALRDGKAPAWLVRRDVVGTPYRVYEVR